MKKIKTLLHYVFAAGIALYIAKFTWFIVSEFNEQAHPNLSSLYRLDHPNKKKYPEISIFLYSKKFAALTGLDPAQAVELEPGLEAIEFRTKPELKGSFANVGFVTHSEIAGFPHFYRAAPLIHELFKEYDHPSEVRSCTFYIYADEQLKLEMPRTYESHFRDDFDIPNDYRVGLNRLKNISSMEFKETASQEEWKTFMEKDDIKREARRAQFKKYHVNSGYPPEQVVFFINTPFFRKKAHQPMPWTFKEIWHTWRSTSIANSIDVDAAQRGVLPGIDYFQVDDNFANCRSLYTAKIEPILLIRRQKDPTRPPEFPPDKNGKKSKMNNFYHAKLPNEFTHNPVFKAFQNMTDGVDDISLDYLDGVNGIEHD